MSTKTPTAATKIGAVTLEYVIGSPAEALAKRLERAYHDAEGADWVLVPREPTPEMLKAGENTNRQIDTRWDDLDADEFWRAMLAASPNQQPGSGQGEG